jgi:error-prone DNA polymerase
MKKPSTKSLRSGASLLDGPDIGDLFDEPRVALPAMVQSEHVAEDYVTTGLSLKAHPCQFFRDDLTRLGVITSEGHREEHRRGRRVAVAGLVLVRQRPGTAKGVVFLTMEDETGIVNVIVWPKVFEAKRRIVMSSKFLLVRGRLEREGLVIHVVAEELLDLTPRLAELSAGETALPAPARTAGEGSWKSKSRDFH